MRGGWGWEAGRESPRPQPGLRPRATPVGTPGFLCRKAQVLWESHASPRPPAEAERENLVPKARCEPPWSAQEQVAARMPASEPGSDEGPEAVTGCWAGWSPGRCMEPTLRGYAWMRVMRTVTQHCELRAAGLDSVPTA